MAVLAVYDETAGNILSLLLAVAVVVVVAPVVHLMLDMVV